MFLSEWCEFPSAPCIAGRKTWWQLASRCCWNRARRLTCFRASFLPGRAKDLSAPRYKKILAWPTLRSSGIVLCGFMWLWPFLTSVRQILFSVNFEQVFWTAERQSSCKERLLQLGVWLWRTLHRTASVWSGNKFWCGHMLTGDVRSMFWLQLPADNCCDSRNLQLAWLQGATAFPEISDWVLSHQKQS